MGNDSGIFSIGLFVLFGLLALYALISRINPVWGQYMFYAAGVLVLWVVLSGLETPNYSYGFALTACLVVGFVFGRATAKTKKESDDA
jgi:hypothetical protein